MGVKIATTQVPVVATESVALTGGIESSETKVIGEVTVPLAHSTVTVELSYTKNLGDFNSCRVMVGISRPCQPNQEDEVLTAAYAKSFCEDRISEILSDI